MKLSKITFDKEEVKNTEEDFKYGEVTLLCVIYYIDLFQRNNSI